MTKKEICLNNPAIAYYSGFGGLELHSIEHGVDCYLYCVSGAWCSNKSYHKLKIYHNRHGDGFVKLHGYKIPTADFIRMN